MSKFPLFCITLLLLTASCALSQDVQYNFDKTANFSDFKTYKWITLENESPIDKLTDEQIRATVDAAFAQKGLRKVEDDGSAHLLVGYQSNEGVERRFAQLPGYGVGPGWSAITGETSAIYEGQLAIDMYDPAHHRLLVPARDVFGEISATKSRVRVRCARNPHKWPITLQEFTSRPKGPGTVSSTVRPGRNHPLRSA